MHNIVPKVKTNKNMPSLTNVITDAITHVVKRHPRLSLRDVISLDDTLFNFINTSRWSVPCWLFLL
jgi:hypothetical protein